MAYAKSTFSQLQLSFAYRYGASSIAELSNLAQVKHFLNKGVQYCASELKIVKQSTVTVTSGTGTLPTEFKAVERVYDSSNNELKQISKEKSEGVTGLYFWITGNHLDGFVLNVPADGDYDVYHTFYPSDMVNDADICIIPDAEAVVAYCYGMIRKSETDPLEDADKALSECDNRLTSMKGDMTENDAPLQFEIL